MSDCRKVTRVLVMLEYEPGDLDNGEVFDLTALTNELAGRPASAHHYADIELSVKSSSDYSQSSVDGKWPLQSEITWKASVDFNGSGRASHLDDAINASMPDSIATQDLRKKLSKLRKKVESLAEDIQVQRLRDAAAVRNKYPIARVTENKVLPEVAEKVQP